MMRPISLGLFLFAAASLLVSWSCRQSPRPERSEEPAVEQRTAVQDKIHAAAQPFPLSQVRLLEGPFRDAMERDKQYLLALEPDRLLAGFRINAGLAPKGERYGGWEQESLAGHSLGHYLSACSLMYAATGDERLQQRADYITGELAQCQRASGDGYLAAFENGRTMFAEIARGEIRPRRFYLNGIWAPWYTMHKVLAGLRDAYLLAGRDEALAVMRRLGDWAIETTKHLSAEQFQHMLECEHGGMNEALADLYALSGERKYLELAQRFNHEAVLQPLSRGVDDLQGLHGNTQIPKVIGAARQYELTADDWLKDTARFFWKTVVGNHTFAIGGHGDNEYFGPPGGLSAMLSSHTAETCNTYNMLKLTAHLFSWTPREEYAAYYERALFNHILASQHPETGMMCYFVPLGQGVRKRFSTPENSFWCCVGTGMENHARYGEAVYWRDEEGLYVNLFIASRLDWPERGVVLPQETRFPKEQATKIVLENSRPAQFKLRIRKPSWAGAEFSVAVNGAPQPVPDGSGYVALERTWRSGDAVDVRLPMDLRRESLPDDPNRTAILYGPVVLAGLLGEAGDAEGRDLPEASGRPAGPVRYLAPSDPDVSEWMQPVEGEPLRFKTRGAGRPGDIEFAPLYQTVHGRYSVYWDLLTPRLLELRRYRAARERARLAGLDRRTIDLVDFGDKRSEEAHCVQGEFHRRGRFRGEGWRQAERGWFSFELKTLPSEPVDLVCRYWGGDGRYNSFDILFDGTKIASEKLTHERPGQFIDVAYPIPFRLTRGLERGTVRFQSIGAQVAGSVFQCRTVRLRETPLEPGEQRARAASPAGSHAAPP